MKKTILLFITIISIVLVCFLCISCGKDKESDDGTELTGFITLKLMNNGSNDLSIGRADESIGEIYSGGISVPEYYVGISSANNIFVCWGTYYNPRYNDNEGWHCGIADLGKNVNVEKISLPDHGWAPAQMSAQPKHLYLVRYRVTNELWRYTLIYVKDFIENTYGGIIGAEVQYREWEP